MYKDVDLAWAAGFLDGEGCIHLSERKRKNKLEHELRLCASQVGDAPILRLKKLFSGNIRYGKEDVSTWEVSNLKAIQILKLLKPYFVVKNKQVALALKYENLHIGKGGALTKKVINKRIKLTKKLKQLKPRNGYGRSR
jgi:hypothetical protein